jgi:hypothetical protein
MADPLSIAAILGIIYAGRKLGTSSVEEPNPEAPPPPAATNKPEEYEYNDGSRDLLLNHLRQPGLISEPVNKKQEVGNFGDIAFSSYVHGEPTHDLSSRYYVSSKMNNLPPVGQIQVGPGLGLNPEIPASGGFQQLYRVNPNNVGAYKLTTLPGRIAPGADVTGWRSGMVGELTHFAPSKTAFLPTRRPEVGNRAQGQGGAVSGTTIRESYVKTMRPSIRSETGYRGDGLEFAPAKRFVPTQESQDAPSRNKGDGNIYEYDHTNNPQPGIHSFVGGYTIDPAARLMEQRPDVAYSEKQLEQFGLRGGDKRAKGDRPGNAGRMNVRAGPLNQGGMLTAVRTDSDVRTDNYFGGMNGESGYRYVDAMYYKFNAYKGQPDIHTNDLNIAKRQLAKNPLAHSIS